MRDAARADRSVRARCALRAAAAIGVALAAIAAARPAPADPAVFAGDPIDAAGRPRIVLPGVPFIDWGADEKWQTADDVFDLGIVGDVDLVIRGGAAPPEPGPIPSGAPSLAAAPEVVAGGTTLTAGTELPYHAMLSDGASPPSTGGFLAAHDLDGRGVLVFAYADLDGDGILGPTAGDAAGTSDDALEAQEALVPVGRRLAVLDGGVAGGALAVSAGLPASRGGLGLVLAAGALAGSLGPLYDDGPWIATLLPCLLPPDPSRILGGNARPPDPLALVDIEIELERVFRPLPGHPLLGTPFAIPLDGTAATNDLARAVSGPARGIAFARAIDPTGFVADPARRVLPAVEADGTRRVLEPVSAIVLADDGPGAAVGVVALLADALGNQADPPSGGAALTVVASPNLRIVAPDGDGDPLRETVALASAGLVELTIDDAGGAGDGGARGHLVASLDGTPAAAVRVELAGGPPTGAVRSASIQLRRGRERSQDRLTATITLEAEIASLDLAQRDLTLAFADDAGRTFYTRTFPAGSLLANRQATSFRTSDPVATPEERVQQLVVRRGPRGTVRVVLRLARLDLRDLDPAMPSLAASVAPGARRFDATVPCRTTASGRVTTCR